MLANDHSGRRERLLEHIHRSSGLDVTSHVDIERGTAGLRMRVNRDMPAADSSKARYAVWRAVSQVHEMHVGTGQIGTAPQRHLDVLGVVQPVRAEQVYYEVAAGKAGTHPILKPTGPHAVPGQSNGRRYDIARRTRGFTKFFLLGGA